jgi:hypothetical protein
MVEDAVMSLLTDRLIATVHSRLPHQPMKVGGAEGVVVVFPAAHSDVGDIEVHDKWRRVNSDGGELHAHSFQ